jgi:hypothetical protein
MKGGILKDLKKLYFDFRIIGKVPKYLFWFHLKNKKRDKGAFYYKNHMKGKRK